VVKWDLDNAKPMKGAASKEVLWLILHTASAEAVMKISQRTSFDAHPSSASHYRGPTSPQEHVVAEWLYRNLDVVRRSERAYCVSMPIDNLILQGSASAGKPGRRLVTPAVAQWALIGILVILFGLSRTEGAIGTFLRSFSTFLFP